MMRVAVAFMLLISFTMAFNLEKGRIAIEDESDEQSDLQEQDEFDLNELGDYDEQKKREEQDEFDLNERGDYYEQKERGEQDENDEDNKLEERFFGQHYCCTHECFYTPPECFTNLGTSFST